MSALPNAWLETLRESSVRADVNYLSAGGERPVSYTYQPPEGVPWTTGDLAPMQVRIWNARPLVASGELGLDESGFTLVPHASALTDFSDDDAIRTTYYDESVEVIRAATGAEKVVVFDHTLRDSQNGSRATSTLREPVLRVHNDQTLTSAPRRVRDHLPPDEAEARLKNRFAIVNLWRPLAEVEQFPLALCDARTIEPHDLVPSDLVYRDKVGETYSFLHNPSHRWYWFPRLRPDEPLLLKIHDSRKNVARLTAHTAFELDHGPRTQRRSIELRALVFWPAAT